MVSKLLFLIFVSINFAYGYKLLVYNPKFGYSHVKFLGTIADLLASAGHEVVMYMPEYSNTINTTGSNLARVISRPKDFEVPFGLEALMQDKWSIDGHSGGKMQKQLTLVEQAFSTLCQNQIQDDVFLNKLLEEKFDLALSTPFDACYYGILEKIGLKNYITIFPGTMFENIAAAIGIPATLSFFPTAFAPSKPPMTYIQRAKNLVGYIMGLRFMDKQFFKSRDDILKPILGENFNVMEKAKKSTFFFVNIDEHLEFPRPISHKTIYVGGIGQVQPKPLEKKYLDILNNSKKGVILVSFGSNAKSSLMPLEMKKIFLETFAKFPDIIFLWKYENEEDRIAEGYENVVTGTWLPQTDILNHPKVIAFISHGGINSINEATAAAVPLICIPLFAEQLRNAIMVEYRGIGIKVEKKEIMDRRLEETIKTILEDQSFSINAKRLRKMMKSKPMSSEERIIKYTEFAAKFGPNNNLHMQGSEMNFMQFYCLDIIIPVVGLMLLLLYIVYRIFNGVLRKFILLLGVIEKNKIE